MALCLALSFAETGSGHRGSVSCSIEAIGSVDNSVNGSVGNSGNGSRLVPESRLVVTNVNITLGKHHDTGPPFSLLPPRGPTPAKRVPPTSEDKNLLTTSSFMERFQSTLSMWRRGKGSHGSEQLFYPIIFWTSIVIGVFLFVYYCCLCSYHAHSAVELLSDQPSEVSQATTFRQATTTPGRGINELDQRQHRFRGWLKNAMKNLVRDLHPTRDDAARGDNVTAEDRVAIILRRGDSVTSTKTEPWT